MCVLEILEISLSPMSITDMYMQQNSIHTAASPQHVTLMLTVAGGSVAYECACALQLGITPRLILWSLMKP